MVFLNNFEEAMHNLQKHGHAEPLRKSALCVADALHTARMMADEYIGKGVWTASDVVEIAKMIIAREEKDSETES